MINQETPLCVRLVYTSTYSSARSNSNGGGGGIGEKRPCSIFSISFAFCPANCNKIGKHFITRKTAGRHDACTRAQEKLHPSCAQRPDLGDLPLSNSVSFTSALPGCHVNAEFCREDPNCR